MKKLLFFILSLSFSLFAQSQSNPTPVGPGIVFTSSAPPPAQNVSASIGGTGTPGQPTYYYFVVAKYPVGNSPISSPGAAINGPPATLSSGNYVQVGWTPQQGATGYDVVRLLTPTVQGNSCTTCLIVSNTSLTSIRDISNSTLGSYSFNAKPQASATESLNNQNYIRPSVVFAVPPPQNIGGVGVIEDIIIDPSMRLDASASNQVLPMKVVATLPTTCDKVGQEYYYTGAAAGFNYYACTAINVISPESGGGGGGTCSTGSTSANELIAADGSGACKDSGIPGFGIVVDFYVGIGSNQDNNTNIKTQVINIGDRAGSGNTATDVVAIGNNANQGGLGTSDIIAIGNFAAEEVGTGSTDIIAIGRNTIVNGTGTGVIAIGIGAAGTVAGVTNVVAIGTGAASGDTTNEVVALGTNAAASSTGSDDLVAIGNGAGNGNSGGSVVAIGNAAGNGNTHTDVVILGDSAVATADHQAVLGGATTTTTIIKGISTGAATGKNVVCIDTATGQLYASSSGATCAN